MPEGERPHPRRTYRRGVDLEDAADHTAVREHVEVIIVPLAGRAACCGSKTLTGAPASASRFTADAAGS
jgi:hypothetical protein